MDPAGSQQVPDLASVLRTLATFSQPAGAPVGPASSPQGWSTSGASSHDFTQRSTNTTPPSSIFPNTSLGQVPRSDIQSLPIQHNFVASAPRAQRHPPIDCSTITDWSAGLRAVSKLGARNEQLQVSVKKMIAEQHVHEKQWWESRKALIEKQNARVEGNEKLRHVLRAVGGAIAEVPEQTSLSNQEELQLFENKVYRASKEMVDAMTAELRASGVPFFCTKPDLISSSEKEEAAAEIDREPLDPNGRLTHDDLLNLQRRMLEYLEDMYKD